jgi:hypothetical protein
VRVTANRALILGAASSAAVGFALGGTVSAIALPVAMLLLLAWVWRNRQMGDGTYFFGGSGAGNYGQGGDISGHHGHHGGDHGGGWVDGGGGGHHGG